MPWLALPAKARFGTVPFSQYCQANVGEPSAALLLCQLRGRQLFLSLRLYLAPKAAG